MMERGNPVLFACGVPRSGTTLLQRMLNSHPDVAVANDTHFIPRALEKTDRKLVDRALGGEQIPLTDALVENVIAYHRFSRLELSQDRLKSALKRSEFYDQLVANLYSEFAKANGKKLAGEKTPDYCRRLDLLNAMFPESKHLHIVRDGRNVALSLLQWAKPDKGPGRIEMWKTQPIAVCALWWRWLAMEGLSSGARIGDSYFQIKYETLVAEPESTLREISQFLEIEYSSDMLHYNRGKERSAGSAKSAWRAPVAGLRSWETQMPAADARLFESLAGDALEAFGYELRYQDHDSKTEDIAEHCRRWWQSEFKAHKSVASPSNRECIDQPCNSAVET